MNSQKLTLESILNELPYPVITEYKFHDKRRFRLDYFIRINSNNGLGVEYDGAVYQYGRHNRPTGFINDCTKFNLATSQGIPVLRFTVKHLKEPDKVRQIILETIDNIKLTNNIA